MMPGNELHRLQAAVESDQETMQADCMLLAASGAKEDPDYGYKWLVQVVEYGPGKDGRINWPREPLVAALTLYQGAKVFALNESQHQASQKPFGKSVREIVGWLDNPVDTGKGIEADLYILKSAQWLRDNLVDSRERGNPNLFGLSHDVVATTRQVRIGGQTMKQPVAIKRVEVDVVYDPTNNGRFIKMQAAAGGREKAMDREKLLAALQRANPKSYATIDTATITDEELVGLLAACILERNGDGDGVGNLLAALGVFVPGVVDQLDPSKITKETVENFVKSLQGKSSEQGHGDSLLAAQMREFLRGQRNRDLETMLAASNLPPEVCKLISKQFTDTEWRSEGLTAAIKEGKEMVDKLTGSGRPSGVGGQRNEVGMDSVEKLQAGFDQLFNIQVDGSAREVPSFTSLRAAYVEITGDSEIRGYMDPGGTPSRLQAAYGTATFAYIFGNTMYRRLVRDYAEAGDFGLSRIVGNNIRNAQDFRTLESIRIGYYGDLPVVDPETEDYPDLGVIGDEEVSYAIAQRGGTITVTRKMIINDDMRTVERIISRLPRAARRGLARRAWSKFVDNGTYKGDNKAVFHVDHNNLGSTAYGITSALAAKTAMALQAEPGSGERLMLRPVTVVFPSQLFGIVKNVNEFNPQAVSIDNGNSMYGFFQPAGMIESPFMLDANDWMMFADPNEVEILELAFLHGQQAPEMFVADQPTVGQMFVADKLQYKIRHEYECEIVDYRGCYKAVVA